MPATVDRDHLTGLIQREQATFDEPHPKSRELHEQARHSLLGGVPMHWMTEWPGRFPRLRRPGRGRPLHRRRRPRLRRLLPRRHRRDDRPLAARRRCGDRRAGRARASRSMLPTEDADLGRRGAAPAASACRYWQFALTATDANRFALRLARAAHRPAEGAGLQLVLPRHRRRDLRDRSSDGRRSSPRAGNIGPPVDPAVTTVVGRVQRPRRRSRRRSPTATSPACLAEPALTNIGIVLPEPGFHDGAARAHPRARDAAGHRRDPHDLRRARRLHRGPRPRARLPHARQAARRRRPGRGLRLDARPAERIAGSDAELPTTSTSAASAARWRATRCRSPRCARRSSDVLTDEAFARMIALADALRREGVAGRDRPRAAALDRARGSAAGPSTGSSPAAAQRRRGRGRRPTTSSTRYLHLYALNRGILMTPFHNMALMSPGHHRGRRRPPHRGLRPGARRAGRGAGLMANVYDDEFDEVAGRSPHPGFGARRVYLARRLGSERLGMSVWLVDPGETSLPLPLPPGRRGDPGRAGRRGEDADAARLAPDRPRRHRRVPDRRVRRPPDRQHRRSAPAVPERVHLGHAGHHRVPRLGQDRNGRAASRRGWDSASSTG